MIDTLTNYTFDEMFWYENEGLFVQGSYGNMFQSQLKRTLDSLEKNGGFAMTNTRVTKVTDFKDGCRLSCLFF